MGPFSINKAGEGVLLADFEGEAEVDGFTDSSCALVCLCAFSFR